MRPRQSLVDFSTDFGFICFLEFSIGFPRCQTSAGVLTLGGFPADALVNRGQLSLIKSVSRSFFLGKCPAAERGPERILGKISSRVPDLWGENDT